MQLIECLVNLEFDETRMHAKMELLAMTGNLVPSGKPDFLNVIRYPTIQGMIERNGKKSLLKAVFLLVKDFCSSLNVVRNMNEEQMIECASMLIDECDNFRLEDYVMMFAMARRGDLVEIRDRIDISIITEIVDSYWRKRQNAALRVQEQEAERFDTIGPVIRNSDTADPVTRAADTLAGAIGDLKEKFLQWRNS